MNRLLLCSSAAVAVLAGCGPSRECRLDDPNSCGSGQVCEVVEGREKPMCFEPLQLQGRVFDLDTQAGVASARVAAEDANGAPVGAVTISGSDGTYALAIPTRRADEKGTPIGSTVTLRASAEDYQSFPSGLRVALPIDTSPATQDGDSSPWVLTGGAVEVGLFKLPQADLGNPSIGGKVQVSADQRGVLVVAEATGQPGHAAITDASGEFVIFNVPPGAYSVRAFAQGVNYVPVDATVIAGTDVTGLQIDKSTSPTGTLQGTVQMVQLVTPNAGATSVIMVVASTFNANIARGEAPVGLRVADVTGAFSIDGVPDGDYAVLAAFENDGLVRDPNTATAGTQIQYVNVTGGTPDRQPSFKVTSAIAMVGPGADSQEATTATPRFTWASYPSADTYDLLVFDTFGNLVWESTNVTVGTSGNVSADYAGPALSSAGIYQWRAIARALAGQPMSQTEDLRGLFQVQ
jgi:hypothetical protein